jgi:hypothetical protein
MAESARVLVKLRPGPALAAAASRANVRPLFDQATVSPFAAAAAPSWHLADIPDGGPTAWDAAHNRIADQLGVNESDVLIAEPDLPQCYPDLNEGNKGKQPFAFSGDCQAKPQENTFNRVAGPSAFAWHLGDDYTQLASARDAVEFSDPNRTRIGHIDTGYDKGHSARPERIVEDLERNFVTGDGRPNDAQDPNRRYLFDNSGHGTGTIGILAGRQIASASNQYLGGAPQAEILPLRIANSVVLFFTSAFATALQHAIVYNCDVISISMGGLPSAAWNETVNAAYEAGVCIVAAAGDCFGGLPTHNIVYPARYHRAIAACGVMADGKPYFNLPPTIIEGSFGPDSAMSAALATYSPNVPWARFGCPSTIDLNGQGTSAATPQIAAAAALWYEKYKAMLPRDWRRVEAVRHALFSSAAKANPRYFGQGILKARNALNVAPVLNLPKTQPDSDSFSFFRVITGMGLSDPPAREQMFNLELSQRLLMNPDLQKIVPDPAASVSEADIRKFMEVVIHDKNASVALRRHVANRYNVVSGTQVQGAPADVVPPVTRACGAEIVQPPPAFRRIRTYAVDPSFSTEFDKAAINEVVLKVRWEPDLAPGPMGEYLEIIDKDAAGNEYRKVDLNDPSLLAQDGCSPAEGNPAFHQQMVYAVSMTTISIFESALGRPVLWRAEPAADDKGDKTDEGYRQRLIVRPHALHEANAYYTPQEIALLFGYFEASDEDPGNHVPGSAVYSCLSHDIVAHETTHAILDGMHKGFNDPSNPDVLALHEAFADIVALMQHFTIPEILADQIARTRGNIEAESILGSLAVQFGRAIGSRGALRNAIGTLDANNKWQRLTPDPSAYAKTEEPHARGALLVASVFDAFLAIYKSRTADLLRIYTQGTGVLPDGAIHPDLVHRLAHEAAKSAGHVLRLCIRAIDYVPPVDITFGEYLRGIITADSDLVPDDTFHYRVAFIEAFRKRGIYPLDLNTLSEDTLRWRGVELHSPPTRWRAMLDQLKRYANACFYIDDRRKLFLETRKQRSALQKLLATSLAQDSDFAKKLQLNPAVPFQVEELRRSLRTTPSGQTIPQAIVGIVQSRSIQIPGSPTPAEFHGGSTVVVDLSKPEVQYVIYKNVDSKARQDRTAAFLADNLRDPLRTLLIAPNQKEPFAALHAVANIGGF